MMKKRPQRLQLDDARAKKLQPLARRIVDHLMTVYDGKEKPCKRGTRLAIMRSLGKVNTFAGPEENLGGLCRDAAIERVVEVLAAGVR